MDLIETRLDHLIRQMDEFNRVAGRSPSKAAGIGNGRAFDEYGRPDVKVEPHTALKAALGGNYQAGALVTALLNAGDRDAEAQAAGKASLRELGLRRYDRPDFGFVGKATLGTTGATGGYVLPNNLVDAVIKPATAEAIYSDLCTIRTGVAVRGVDQPYRTGAPARMQFQNWGATKENVNEAYGSYTATLGTLAKIYDVAKQYLRFSAGAAEQDVMDELAKSYRLGENFAVIAGPGTGTVGVGDPTTGVYTALAAGAATYTTTFVGASTSTIAGAAATAIASGIKALAKRSRRPTACVMDAETYWTIVSEGSDTAGFWLDPRQSGGFTFNAQGGLSLWGMPVLWDPNFDTNTGTTKAAIVGDWSALKLFRGIEFRIDSSDVAGTRWDDNLVGFRGEAELGVNASAAVSVGAFQLLKAIIP